jgi:hypothetical protein
MINSSKEERKDSLSLKWGTLKRWDFHSEKAIKLWRLYCNGFTKNQSAMIMFDMFDSGNSYI